jgi:hypothetical protein
VIEVYIGLHSGGWALDGRTQGWSAHADPVQGLERWAREIGQRHAGRWRWTRADLWLSGGLARPFLCGPLAGLKSWREAEAFAVAVAPEATGLEGPCRVQLEDWPGDVSAIGTALDAVLAEAMDAVANSCRISWRSIRPRWAAALDDILAQRLSTALVAVAEEDALTLLCGSTTAVASPRGLELASTYAPAPDPAQTTALWHRLMLSHDVPADDAWLVHLAVPEEGVELAVPTSDRGGAWPRLVQLSEGFVA